jgi:4-hydroxybenzoyl-CoA reductase subunit beta
MSLPDFQLLRPHTLGDALDLLAKVAPEVQIVAGGTDLVPSLRQKLFAPRFVLDLRGVRELRGFTGTSDGLAIGALTTLTAIERSDLIRRDYPVLAQAAATVASPVLRNMGTLGGNICLDTRCLWYNQSLAWRKSCGFCIKKDGDLCHVAPGGSKCWAVFSGDTPPALLCLDAEIEIASPTGVRRIPLREFYTNIGDARMKLEKNEILARVYLPRRTAGWRGTYRKLRIRGSIDYPLAGVAIAIGNGSRGSGLGPENPGQRSGPHEVRVALTAVNPAPLLVKNVDRALQGREVNEETASTIADLAARTAKPLTTSALTPEYRREMIRVFTKRALLELVDGRQPTVDSK